jgi:2-haloalkanoic acid dehalogenase type II
MRLHDFAALSFDCYGTLIDWETGLLAALAPLLRAAAGAPPAAEVLARFARHESAQQERTPAMPYPQILAEVHRRLARDFGAELADTAHESFGASVPQWPAFADSPAALQYLKRHYKLVILSNVDRASFKASNARLGVEFDAICTAEDIGSYKPDPRNFRYLIATLASLGVKPGEVLHTAQSLFHDHAPAQQAGLASAWIDRKRMHAGGGAARQPASLPRYDFRFETLAEFAQAHQAEGARV